MTQLDHSAGLTRREFGKRTALASCGAKLGGLALLSSGARRLRAASGIGEALRASMEGRKIPAVAAAVANADQVFYEGDRKSVV
jgi:hypothetical protein